MGFERDNYQYPGVSTFKKEADGVIYLVANDAFGPGDDYSSPWHFFDLLDSGVEGFNPKVVKKRENNPIFIMKNRLLLNGVSGFSFNKAVFSSS